MKKTIIFAALVLFLSSANSAFASSNVTVISPNGGNTYKESQIISIKWNAPNIAKNQKVQISLKSEGSNVLFPIAEALNRGQYTWRVKNINEFYDSETREAVIPNGKYKIVISCIGDSCDKNFSKSDESDDFFEIVSTEKHTATVRVTYPKSNVVVKAGKVQLIKWQGAYFPQNGKVALSIVPSTPGQNEGRGPIYSTAILKNTGAINWNVPTNMPAGKYRILIACVIDGSESTCDNNAPSATSQSEEFTIIPTAETNNIPSVTIGVDGNNATVGEGTTFTYKITDADTKDSHGIKIDHGDGSTSEIHCATQFYDSKYGKLFHHWTRPGVFTVTITVDDCRGGVVTETQTITVGPLEGTITLSLSELPANNPDIIASTSTDTAVYALNISAIEADVSIQTLDLETEVTRLGIIENPAVLINTVKVWNGSTTIATIPASGNAFVRDADSKYYIRIPGINLNIPKDTTRRLLITFLVNPIDERRVVILDGYKDSSVRAVSGNGISKFYSIDGYQYSRKHAFHSPSSLSVSLVAPVGGNATPTAPFIPVNGDFNFNLKADLGASLIAPVVVNATSTAPFIPVVPVDGNFNFNFELKADLGI